MKLSNLPLCFFFLLLLLSCLLQFNGLYGQDAHEYLRQSMVILERLQGRQVPLPGPGDAELAGGYPMLGALFQLLGLEARLALKVLSCLSAAVSVFLFERILSVLSPGAHSRSRWVFGLLGLALAPYFLRAGLTVMSDALGLALLLAALFFALRMLEQQRYSDVLGFAVFSVGAIGTRYALAGLLWLPALALGLELFRVRRIPDLLLATGAALLTYLPFWWLKSGAPASPLAHSLLHDWSLFHLFKKDFVQISGSISYTLPNLAYLFFPAVHPGFCLTLPALFLLAKRTDIHLYSKRLLALSLLCYLIFLGGLAHQNLRYLLPAYAMLLLLLFPAWDRFFAYGLYFFKRLTYALLGLTVVCQLVFSVYVLRPAIIRNRLECQIADRLAPLFQAGDVLYAFDLDIALQTYLPVPEYRNMWLHRYDDFPVGSYILFNAPKLRAQWAGQPPMLNWEYASTHFVLQEVQHLPEGWTLYRVLKPK